MGSGQILSVDETVRNPRSEAPDGQAMAGAMAGRGGGGAGAGAAAACGASRVRAWNPAADLRLRGRAFGAYPRAGLMAQILALYHACGANPVGVKAQQHAAVMCGNGHGHLPSSVLWQWQDHVLRP